MSETRRPIHDRAGTEPLGDTPEVLAVPVEHDDPRSEPWVRRRATAGATDSAPTDEDPR